MEPLVEGLRGVNVLPQVQVTWVSTYSGWMFCFMVSSRVRSPGRPLGAVFSGVVNRNQPTSVPGTIHRAPIGVPAPVSTWGGGVFFPFQGAAYGVGQRVLEQREHHPSDGALTLDRLDHEPAAVVVEDRLHDPQAQAGAADLGVDGVGGTEEPGRDPVHVRGGDADP